MSDETPEPGMEKETITKPDGRYLIYYTFADEDTSVPQRSSAKPSADEERTCE